MTVLYYYTHRQTQLVFTGVINEKRKAELHHLSPQSNTELCIALSGRKTTKCVTLLEETLN